MTNETRGFYKTIDNHVFYAEKNVHHKDYDLNIDEYEKYSYPIDGWYYFESQNPLISLCQLRAFVYR